MTRLPRSASVLQAAGRVGVEELFFVDANHLGIFRDANDDVVRRADVGRRNPHIAVRHDVVVTEAIVENGLEDLNLLTRNLRAANA